MIVLRPGKKEDHGYVRSTWADSYREAVLPWLPMSSVRQGMARDMLVKLATCTLVVACDVDDPDRIYGWALGSPGVLHYVYMRETRRGMGHGARLVEEAVAPLKPARCTYMTPAAQMPAARRGVIWKRKP